MKKRYILIVSIFFLSVFCFAQQTPQYGQYMFDHFAINPAYAGSKKAPTFIIHYRNQWLNDVNGAPKTFLTSFHTPLRSNKIALGVQVVGDKIGPKKSTGMMLAYVYRIHFNKSALAAGIKLGAIQYVFEITKIEYHQAEPIWGNALIYKSNVPVSDFGLYYNTNTWYAGLSINQILSGKILEYSPLNSSSGNVLTQSQLKPHVYMTYGRAFRLSDNVTFSPSLMLKAAKNAPGSLDINANFLLDEKVWVGVGMRTGYGVGALVQLLAIDKIKIGYAFEKNLKIANTYPGKMTNEILLQFDFNKTQLKMASPKQAYF